MCGIVGVLPSRKSNNSSIDMTTLEAMLDEIFHRGPDARGVWNQGGVWLGHQRLSIVDLSETGAQPMLSQCGNFIIVFNGEVYNFLELKAELNESYQIEWRGESDTEIILEMIVRLGIDAALEKMDGMFALALWNQLEERLIVARDRFGEKPLYYSDSDHGFLFASELKCIEQVESLKLSVDRGALGEYLRVGYVPAPLSIYNEVKKLEPAHYLIYESGQVLDKKCYWDISEKASYGFSHRFGGTEDEAINQLDDLITASVHKRLRADVPLGAFLSGGIDSSLIVSMMQKISKRKINTFSIGFDDKKLNEAEVAKAVAEKLDTNHTEYYLNGDDALEVVPLIAKMNDEPFSDASLIPTFMVSRLAKQKVTVSLSGDGGDELFIGYKRYWAAASLWNKVSKLPYPVRFSLSRLIKYSPKILLNLVTLPLAVLRKDFANWKQYADKAEYFSHLLHAKSYQDIYADFLTRWRNYDEVVIGYKKTEIYEPKIPENATDLESAAFSDISAYMAGDILTKVDRASMSVSLEGRIPLLDHKIAEFAFTLPLSYKWKEGANKHVLRELLYRYVDKSIIDRPKRGFGVPLASWLRGELKDWAYDLIEPEKIKSQGFFDVEIINEHWVKHQSGESDLSSKLWSVIMFQLWLEERPHLVEM